MTRGLVCLLLIVAAMPGQRQAAPSSDINVITVRDSSGTLKGFFQSRPDAYRPGLSLPLRVALGSNTSVRTKDGLVVNGFGFYGWDEGAAVVRLQVFELVPAPGVENKYWWTHENPDPRRVLQARDFAQYTLTRGETRAIDEMKALGIAPMQVGVGSTVPTK